METPKKMDAVRSDWMAGVQEIASHLASIAARVDTVEVSTDDGVARGRLDWVGQVSEIVFLPEALVPGTLSLPGPGASVKVDYEARGVAYSFRTRLGLSNTSDRWSLVVPRAIERTDRRVVHRHIVNGDPSFQLRMEGPWFQPGKRPFPIYDVSTEGVGFFYDPEATPLSESLLLIGELAIPGGEVLPVFVRVVNLRALRPGARLCTAGARFMDLRPDDKERLGRCLSLWAAQHGIDPR